MAAILILASDSQISENINFVEGPFGDEAEAVEYASKQYPDAAWVVAPLHPKEEKPSVANVQQMYWVRDIRMNLVMIAPLEIISKVFMLSLAGAARLTIETKEYGECFLHFNGRDPVMGISAIYVYPTEDHPEVVYDSHSR